MDEFKYQMIETSAYYCHVLDYMFGCLRYKPEELPLIQEDYDLIFIRLFNIYEVQKQSNYKQIIIEAVKNMNDLTDYFKYLYCSAALEVLYARNFPAAYGRCAQLLENSDIHFADMAFYHHVYYRFDILKVLKIPLTHNLINTYYIETLINSDALSKPELEIARQAYRGMLAVKFAYLTSLERNDFADIDLEYINLHAAELSARKYQTEGKFDPSYEQIAANFRRKLDNGEVDSWDESKRLLSPLKEFNHTFDIVDFFFPDQKDNRFDVDPDVVFRLYKMSFKIRTRNNCDSGLDQLETLKTGVSYRDADLSGIIREIPDKQLLASQASYYIDDFRTKKVHKDRKTHYTRVVSRQAKEKLTKGKHEFDKDNIEVLGAFLEEDKSSEKASFSFLNKKEKPDDNPEDKKWSIVVDPRNKILELAPLYEKGYLVKKSELYKDKFFVENFSRVFDFEAEKKALVDISFLIWRCEVCDMMLLCEFLTCDLCSYTGKSSEIEKRHFCSGNMDAFLEMMKASTQRHRKSVREMRLMRTYDKKELSDLSHKNTLLKLQVEKQYSKMKIDQNVVDKINRLKNEVLKLKENNRVALEERDDAIKKISEITQLGEKIGEEASEKISKLESDLVTQGKDLDDVSRQNVVLQEEKAALGRRVSELTLRITERDAEAERMSASLRAAEKARQEHQESSAKQNAELLKENALMAAQIERLMEVNRLTRDAREDLEQRLKEARDDSQKMRSEFERKEKTLQQEHSESLAAVKKQKAEFNEELLEQLKRSDSTLKQKQKELEEKNTLFEKAKAALEEKEKIVADLLRENKEKSEVNSLMKERLEKQMKVTVSMKSDIQRVNEHLQRKRNKYSLMKLVILGLSAILLLGVWLIINGDGKTFYLILREVPVLSRLEKFLFDFPG